jgi:hypothetical protein
LLFFFAELAEIAGGLNVEPESGALFEEFAQMVHSELVAALK